MSYEGFLKSSSKPEGMDNNQMLEVPECKEGFTGNVKIEKSLRDINKELHEIALEFEKLNKAMKSRR